MIRAEKVEAFFLLLVLSFLILSCNSATEPKMNQDTSKLHMKNPVVKKEPKIFRSQIGYRLDSLNSDHKVDSILNNFPGKDLESLLALNRMDKRRLRKSRPVIIPNCTSAQFIDYSPFPAEISLLSCIPKTVLISQRIQAFGLYEDGELVKWGPVSTGKKSTITPNGLFYGNYKAKRKISTVDESWIMPYYFNFMNFEGIGTHQYALPGYPASHGCVRMKMEDAKYIYNWAEMWNIKNGIINKNGTPFMVFGNYDYSESKPWHTLASNWQSNDLTSEEMETLENYLRKYQNDARNFGEGLRGENSSMAGI